MGHIHHSAPNMAGVRKRNKLDQLIGCQVLNHLESLVLPSPASFFVFCLLWEQLRVWEQAQRQALFEVSNEHCSAGSL